MAVIPVRISKPEPLAVKIDDARYHLLLEDSESGDPAINQKIQASLESALEYCSLNTSLAIAIATYEMRFCEWPRCRSFEIPMGPVREISALRYLDADNAYQAVATDQYRFEATQRRAIVTLDPDFSGPTLGDELVDRVVLEFVAGFDNPAESESSGRDIYRLPSTLRSAVLLKMESLFETGAIEEGAHAALVAAADSLLDQCRVLRM